MNHPRNFTTVFQRPDDADLVHLIHPLMGSLNLEANFVRNTVLEKSVGSTGYFTLSIEVTRGFASKSNPTVWKLDNVLFFEPQRWNCNDQLQFVKEVFEKVVEIIQATVTFYITPVAAHFSYQKIACAIVDVLNQRWIDFYKFADKVSCTACRYTSSPDFFGLMWSVMVNDCETIVGLPLLQSSGLTTPLVSGLQYILFTVAGRNRQPDDPGAFFTINQTMLMAVGFTNNTVRETLTYVGLPN